VFFGGQFFGNFPVPGAKFCVPRGKFSPPGGGNFGSSRGGFLTLRGGFFDPVGAKFSVPGTDFLILRGAKFSVPEAGNFFSCADENFFTIPGVGFFGSVWLTRIGLFLRSERVLAASELVPGTLLGETLL
jgi:hypothetical protein